MTGEERAMRERWGDFEIPEGTFLLEEYTIKLSYKPGAESRLSLGELIEKARQGIEEAVVRAGGELLVGPREIDGAYVLLVAFPVASVTVVDMSSAVPPGTTMGDTISLN